MLSLCYKIHTKQITVTISHAEKEKGKIVNEKDA